MRHPAPSGVLAVFMAAFLFHPGLLVAGDEGDSPGAEKATEAPPKAEKEMSKDELPGVAEAVEGMKEAEGLFPIYRKKDRLLALIPKEKLDKPMLLAASIAGGSVYTGWQWSDMMVRFERHDKMVLLVRPDTLYRAGKKEPIASAVERTHPGQLVATLPILGADPQRGVVVDLSDLYSRQAEAFVGPLAKGRDPSLSRLAEAKDFPQNIEVAVDLISKPNGWDYGDILTVHYSLSALPENDYVPRIADDRIGYFLTVSKDYGKDYRDPTTFVRYVNRWKLEKADPDLEVSPPKEPIVFYIEKTVPTRYRRWVRDGILEWNKAFEKIGFTDAVVVRQQTDTQFADLDPEDVRYNFFRWITSDWAFAMGPSRVDPRTGQILDADIIFDDSMVRAYMEDWDLYVEEAMLETRSPDQARFFESHPDWDPLRVLRGETGGASPAEMGPWAKSAPWTERPTSAPEPTGSGRSVCSIGRGMSRQLALASIQLGVLAAGGDRAKDGEGAGGGEGAKGDEKKKADERQWPEEFIGQVVKETVMHEVGHTLGLRHNFKASSWRPYSDFQSADGVVEDLSASVMDYNPLNLAADGKQRGRYQMTTLGPYDIWAIAYGYTVTGAKDPDAEKEQLQKIASNCPVAGHDYATDEDIWLGDPLTNRWDFGADTLEFAKSRIALARRLKDEVVERIVREGESYETARGAMNILFSTIGHASYLASRYVGGTYFHRDHRGDPGARDPIVVVPGDRQKEALALVRDNLFQPDSFELPPDLVRKLAPSRWSHWGTGEVWGVEAAYPFHEMVLAMQLWSLSELMSPSTLGRIADTEMAASADDHPLTLPDLFNELTGAIFSELKAGPRGGTWTNETPFVGSIRRNLQREYVARLIALTLSDESSSFPRAARTLAWYQLRTLNDTLDAFLDGRSGAALDDYSRAHLEESRERIKRALDASFQLRS